MRVLRGVEYVSVGGCLMIMHVRGSKGRTGEVWKEG